MVEYACYSSPLGQLLIGWEHDSVTSIRLSDAAGTAHHPSPVSDLAASQLQEYFAGSRKDFTFSINPDGTAFQRHVWHALMQIPYGKTRTYGEIAAMVGKPNASRAVGMACNRNPLWIVIPCHRVVGKNGSLTGYEGGLEIKKALLELEKTNR